MLRGYKVELDLNQVQRTACLKHAGVARFTYNWGILQYQQAYQAGQKTPTAISLHKQLNALKVTDFPWMYQVSKCAPQEALRNLESAFKQFFGNVAFRQRGTSRGKPGYPQFKSKKKGIGSFRLTGAIHLGEKTIQLPRLGSLRVHEEGYLPVGARVLSATVSEQAGRWYVSVQVDVSMDDPIRACGTEIGIDLGITSLATVSNGLVLPNPKALRTNLKKLKRMSRQHSRKQKGSKNRAKAARKLARLHARIAHIRQDALHQATSLIVAKTKPPAERPAVIVLEDLHVAGMLKNRNLSRAIAEVGWAEFRRQIVYKAEQAGSEVLIVSQWEPSSKTCSCCGWQDEDLTLADRIFCCEACGYAADRDANASINLALKAAGQGC